jgi:hypothetical protein
MAGSFLLHHLTAAGKTALRHRPDGTSHPDANREEMAYVWDFKPPACRRTGGMPKTLDAKLRKQSLET